MKKYNLLFLLITVIFMGCRKVDLDKSSQDLLGKWEVYGLTVEGYSLLYRNR